MILDQFLDGRVIVKVGDITEEETDAIVNAANSTLLGGGGVDGAIHRKGGPQILKECQEIRLTTYPNGLPTGEAVITSGGNLKARFVIHTVGPIYGHHAGREDELLANAYRNSLRLAAENNLRTIAFPSISTGAFSFPSSRAAEVSSQAIKEFLNEPSTIETVNLVFFLLRDGETFLKSHRF
jgi:O-acetyl-ADP-ribose deacetylase